MVLQTYFYCTTWFVDLYFLISCWGVYFIGGGGVLKFLLYLCVLTFTYYLGLLCWRFVMNLWVFDFLAISEVGCCGCLGGGWGKGMVTFYYRFCDVFGKSGVFAFLERWAILAINLSDFQNFWDVGFVRFQSHRYHLHVCLGCLCGDHSN